MPLVEQKNLCQSISHPIGKWERQKVDRKGNMYGF